MRRNCAMTSNSSSGARARRGANSSMSTTAPTRLSILMKVYSEPEPMNVGCGEDLTIVEIARLVADVVGFEGRIVPRSNQTRRHTAQAPQRRPAARLGMAPQRLAPRRPGQDLRLVSGANRAVASPQPDRAAAGSSKRSFSKPPSMGPAGEAFCAPVGRATHRRHGIGTGLPCRPPPRCHAISTLG